MPRREQRQRRKERQRATVEASRPSLIQKYRAWILGGGVGAVIVALLAFGVANSISGDEDFEFTAYGSTHTLGIEERSAGFVEDILAQGKPVVLNFWGGTCPPCRAEMPDFQAAFDEYGEEAIFLGLDVGPFTGLGSRSDARALLQELGISYPTAYPSGDPTRDFSIVGLPQTIFYDGEGNKVAREGFLSETRLNRILTSTLDLVPASERDEG